MKKSLLPVLLLAVVALVLFGIFSAGDKHVTVVDKNVTLAQQNTQLKSENTQLKTENTELVTQNKQLVEKVEEVTMMADSLVEATEEKPVPVIVQDKIETKYGWATPDYVFESASQWYSSGFRVQGSGFRLQGLGFRLLRRSVSASEWYSSGIRD